jgi:hypothetical protein
METEMRLVPPGEYTAMVADFDKTAFEVIDFTYKSGERAGTPGQMTKFTVPFSINDPKIQEALGREKATVTKQIILDFAADGSLDFGPDKNLDLGRLRAAVGQNTPGPWSPAQLRGAGPLMVKVEHREFKRRDGSQGKGAEVTRTVKIS